MNDRMKPHDATELPPPEPPLDAEAIDRLVDGEMDLPEQKALLRRLDAEPNGWKRCALAYIEAQTWRGVMSADPSGASQRSAPSRSACGPASISRRNGKALRLIGAAAAMAAMFALGVGAADWLPLHRDHNHRPNLVQRPSIDLPDNTPAPHQVDDAAPTPAENPGWMPVANGLPDFSLRQIQRQGYNVVQEQRDLAVTFDDGEQATIPLKRVELRYVGHRIH